MTRKPDRIISYCMSIAQEFQARLSRMQIFVKHNLSSGTANEIILRNFLSNHVAGDFHVGQGFICDPTSEDRVSRQCDILIYNQNDWPLVYSDGDIRVVWPQSVTMVVEVKTNLDKKDINSSIQNIVSARELNPLISGVIFAFKSPSLATVIRNLDSYPGILDNDHAPVAILLFDKDIIIHRWGWSRRRDIEKNSDGNPDAYTVRIGKKKQASIVVTFLLLLFFSELHNPLGSASNVNMLMQILEEYTDRKPDIYIGQTP